MSAPWISEELFFDGDSYFESVLAAIACAKNSIDIETYIFRNDAVGERLSQALIDAAHRSVKVRFLADGFGSVLVPTSLTEPMEAAGISFRIYNPLHFFRRMNRRNHRKLMLIDGAAWVGSLNITSDHCSKKWNGKGWRDTAVKVTGPPVTAIAASFEKIWSRGFGVLPATPWLRLNSTRRLRWYANRDLLQRIRCARNRIWITSAYFVPRTRMALALSRAAQRGVDVRILVPAVSDLFFAPWVARLYSVILCRAGARYFEYLPSVLHAKSALVDDWAFVGSSNFNHRSYIHDLELDVVLASAESKRLLAEQFMKDCAKSIETRGQDAHRGIIGFIARLLWRIRWYA